MISDIYFPTKQVHGELGPCSVQWCRVSADAPFQRQLCLAAALSFLHGVVKEPVHKQCTGSRRAETMLASARPRSAAATATKLCWKMAQQGKPHSALAADLCAPCGAGLVCLPQGTLLLCPRQQSISKRSKVAVVSLKHFLPPRTSKSCGPFSASQCGRWC